MVFLLKRWKDFKESLEYARFIFYQVIDDGDIVEIRAKAGKIAFRKIYNTNKPEDKKELEEALNFLKNKGIEVEDVVPEDLLFQKVIA